MSDKSGIEWTDATWSPTTGCDRISAGCDNCYALTMAARLKAMGSAKYQTDGDPRTSGPGFGLTVHEDVLSLPFKWRKPKRIFVNSMSDLFHDQVPDAFLDEVFGVMAVAHALYGHTFQVLTKRHSRMRSYLTQTLRTLPGGYIGSTRKAIAGAAHRWAIDRINAGALSDAIEHGTGWPLPGVWIGVSVEDQKWADIRIPALLETPAAVRWLSCEPLLGPVRLADVQMPQWGHAGSHNGVGTADCPRALHHHHDARCKHPIDWLVVGGESGPGSRPMHPDWARSLRDECRRAGVPFFLKQHGQYSAAWGEPTVGDIWLARDGATAEWKPGDGHTRQGVSGEFRWPSTGTVLMRRSRSKHDAGRELDGRLWDEYPAQREPATT